MPQYHVGHQARIQRIESALDSHANLALAGSAYHGVGISDCVRSGEEAAEKLFQQIVHHRPNQTRYPCDALIGKVNQTANHGFHPVRLL